jgi:hypothetical protein
MSYESVIRDHNGAILTDTFKYSTLFINLLFKSVQQRTLQHSKNVSTCQGYFFILFRHHKEYECIICSSFFLQYVSAH